MEPKRRSTVSEQRVEIQFRELDRGAGFTFPLVKTSASAMLSVRYCNDLGPIMTDEIRTTAHSLWPALG